jgi:hypothetical protein
LQTRLTLGLGTAKAVLGLRDSPNADAVDTAALGWGSCESASAFRGKRINPALIEFRAYCGTVTENDSPQVASWLFEFSIMSFLQAIGWILLDKSVEKPPFPSKPSGCSTTQVRL